MRAGQFPLDPVDAVTITTLVDNFSDATLVDEGPAHRARLHDSGVTLPAVVMESGRTLAPLRAEHGFSALVRFQRDGQQHSVLFDTGVSPDGLVENLHCLQLSARDLEAVVLSHGHFDHTAGLDGLARELGRAGMPALLHPDFWNRRRIVIQGREPLELPTISRTALRGVGFEIVEESQPRFIFHRSLLVTGEVDRTTGYEPGIPPQEKYQAGRWLPDPLVLDDQALVLNLRGRGLVVLTGCGHAGIVNIVRYARSLTGIERVYAVLGGFHLGGPIFEPIIPFVCEALAEVGPELIVPTHCTGWRATHTLAARFPQVFIQNSVGTSFELVADLEAGAGT